MPILKQLVSGSSQTKRRSRMDLTREMISAPLGDFRHTMHVGRSGDAFGDTSFLSTRSGEPPAAAREAEPSFPRSPRPGLLSRTFRSSKRSQSVTRVDGYDDGGAPALSGDSPAFVKNAMSLPFLNDDDEDACQAEGGRVRKSLSTSPLKQLCDLDLRPSNGAACAAARSLELDERSFGELTELPCHVQHYGGGGGGMKRADSVMSFHVDLGPSMLGDILDVMQKEDDDLGYEEGEGRASPPLSVRGEEEAEEEEKAEEVGEEEEEDEEAPQQASARPPGSADPERECGGPYTPEFTPETRPRRLQHLDSCSVSSSGSAALEDRPPGQNLGGDADSANFSSPPEEEGNFSSFMEDDEDDEIRV